MHQEGMEASSEMSLARALRAREDAFDREYNLRVREASAPRYPLRGRLLQKMAAEVMRELAAAGGGGEVGDGGGDDARGSDGDEGSDSDADAWRQRRERLSDDAFEAAEDARAVLGTVSQPGSREYALRVAPVMKAARVGNATAACAWVREHRTQLECAFERVHRRDCIKALRADRDTRVQVERLVRLLRGAPVHADAASRRPAAHEARRQCVVPADRRAPLRVLLDVVCDAYVATGSVGRIGKLFDAGRTLGDAPPCVRRPRAWVQSFDAIVGMLERARASVKHE